MCYHTSATLYLRSVSNTIASLKYVLCVHRSRLCRQQQFHYRQPRRHQFVKQLSNFPSKRMSSKQTIDDIRICVVQPQDHQRVLDFLRIHYYQEEPLTVGTEPKQQDKADEEFNMSNIEHGTCLMAVNTRSDAILGALLAGPKGPHEAEHLFEAAAEEGPTKWGIIMEFLAYIERDANVCKRYGVERVLHAHVIGVDAKTRGNNIGGRLMNELKTLGKRLNYELLTTDCTSYYSAQMCERLGWECVNTSYYKEYVDEKQKQIIRSEPPHDSCKTYAVRL